VQVTEYRPDRIAVVARLAEPGLLILSEIYHRDWLATVDGASAQVYKVDGVLRGLPLGAGEHEVVLLFEPASLARGLGIARDVANYALYVVLAECMLRAVYLTVLVTLALMRRRLAGASGASADRAST
jgi:uncharacterized membrane protein YfhO